MDCKSSIFFLSFQDFYTIVLDELVLEVTARHRDDVLAQPSAHPLAAIQSNLVQHACFLFSNIHVFATTCTVCTQCVFCLCCNLDLKVVPEHHLYGEKQPPKQVHLKLWYRNPEKKGKI
jgi:hypothetical protein